MKEIKQNLPGYPHYPASEDILNAGETRVDADVDNMPRNPNAEDLKGAMQNQTPPTEISVQIPFVPGTEGDVTKDDLAALGDENLSHDGGDDEELENRLYPVDISASDLDVPGSELDDENEEIGEEDEENNFYSMGDDELL